LAITGHPSLQFDRCSIIPSPVVFSTWLAFASFPALLFRHPACRTILLHLTGPGHSAPHAITNAFCGVAVETNNNWKSRFRHRADASRYPTEVQSYPSENLNAQ
jgi:hypothetical protein